MTSFRPLAEASSTKTLAPLFEDGVVPDDLDLRSLTRTVRRV
jgi:hypothetical protein